MRSPNFAPRPREPVCLYRRRNGFVAVVEVFVFHTRGTNDSEFPRLQPVGCYAVSTGLSRKKPNFGVFLDGAWMAVRLTVALTSLYSTLNLRDLNLPHLFAAVPLA